MSKDTPFVIPRSFLPAAVYICALGAVALMFAGQFYPRAYDRLMTAAWVLLALAAFALFLALGLNFLAGRNERRQYPQSFQ